MAKRNYYESQLNKGAKIEMEHTSSKKMAKKIANDHLKENIDYYKYSSGKGKEFLVSDSKRYK